MTANNLFNKRPPVDPGSGYPYCNFLNYNAFGRAIFVEMGVHLGAGASKQ